MPAPPCVLRFHSAISLSHSSLASRFGILSAFFRRSLLNFASRFHSCFPSSDEDISLVFPHTLLALSRIRSRLSLSCTTLNNQSPSLT